MFSLNLTSWKQHPFVQSHYTDDAMNELEIELQRIASAPTDRCDTQWGMRQLALEREG